MSEDDVRMEPMDRHNRTLIGNVHPDDWTNPEPAGRYHLVVVGAGTGGLVTAAIAASLGARVALVERHLMGGDCLNVGCVPSKALIRSARAWNEARTAAKRFGAPSLVGNGGDFGAVMERMRRLRAGISEVDGAARFREMGVDVFLGSATFTGEDSLRVGSATLRFRRAVIATGARPLVPPIDGLSGVDYLTNETVFSLTERPRRMIVVGGGPIGSELAQAFARLGSEVTLLDAAERPLPKDDPEAARLVLGALERDGVRAVMNARVERADASDGDTSVHYTVADRRETATGDALLLAVGRAPNTEGLGLEAAGVRYHEKGVEVDDRLRTSNRRIYAVGDICSPLPFTHVADAHARLVVPNALFFGRKKASDLVIPWCTYTSPEVAHTGHTAETAADAGHEVDTITVALGDVDRAELDDETDGFLKVHLRRGGDRILGATLVAEHAGEIISQLTQAINTGMGLGKLGETVFPYPTQAEIIRRAADAYRRRRLTPRAKKIFGGYFRVMR